MQRFRRALALGTAGSEKLIEDLIRQRTPHLERAEQIEFAVMLDSDTSLSQRAIHDITGVSRDTIRKHRNAAPNAVKRSTRTSTTA